MKTLWQSRTPRERFLILGCVVVVAVAAWLVLAPAGGPGKQLLPAAEAKRRYDAALKQIGELTEEIDKLRPATDAMVYDKAPAEIVPEVVRPLQAHAKTAGLRLREIKPLRARQAGTLTRVPISVKFNTAQFSRQAVHFMYLVEDPAAKLVIEKFNVSAADPKSRMVEVEVQVALFTRSGGGTPEST